MYTVEPSIQASVLSNENEWTLTLPGSKPWPKRSVRPKYGCLVYPHLACVDTAPPLSFLPFSCLDCEVHTLTPWSWCWDCRVQFPSHLGQVTQDTAIRGEVLRGGANMALLVPWSPGEPQGAPLFYESHCLKLVRQLLSLKQLLLPEVTPWLPPSFRWRELRCDPMRQQRNSSDGASHRRLHLGIQQAPHEK